MIDIKNVRPVVVRKYEAGENSVTLNTEDYLFEQGIISFKEEVTTETANCLQDQLMVLWQMGKKDVKIYIDSPGGDVISGLPVCATMLMLEKLGMTITTICRGKAASMASLLLMCGSRGHRKIHPHSRVMIHDMSTGMKGKYADLEEEMEFSKSLREELIEIISKRSNKTIDEVREEFSKKRDLWLDGKKAKDEWGVVDEIMTVDYSI